MRDALGDVQRVVLLGGTSEIGQAAVRHLIERRRCRDVTLGARDPSACADFVAELEAADVRCEARAFEASYPHSHEAFMDALRSDDDIDVVIVAFGVLGAQGPQQASAASAIEVAQVNFTGAVSASLAASRVLTDQGHGTLVVLSSVAALRPRAENFVYGASKAGIDAFARGLADALEPTGVHLCLVRPGFVATKMTEGMEPAPFATDPETVGRAIADAIGEGRSIVHVPRVLGPVFAGLRTLPHAMWRRMAPTPDLRRVDEQP